MQLRYANNSNYKNDTMIKARAAKSGGLCRVSRLQLPHPCVLPSPAQQSAMLPAHSAPQAPHHPLQKECYVGEAVLAELKRIIEDSEVREGGGSAGGAAAASSDPARAPVSCAPAQSSLRFNTFCKHLFFWNCRS